MSAYCDYCKMIIRDEDVVHYEEVSEAWGRPVSEDWRFCPKCGEPVEEYYGDPADAVEYENEVGAILRDAMTERGWRE